MANTENSKDSTGRDVRHLATGAEGTVKSDDGFGKITVKLETGPTVETIAPEWQYR
jgi:hypothetical protein